ncbi:MAG TPA: phage holin family protein [Patescibacteria group bacterium]|nr:phage holin family protein [Patescibacteria group bacterium]
MGILLNWLASTLVILIASYVLPGVHVASFWTALLVAFVLGVFNIFLKPLLILLTLPITILTLGLFTIVINAILVLLASTLVSGFTVDSFWSALLFSLLVTLINLIITKIK